MCFSNAHHEHLCSARCFSSGYLSSGLTVLLYRKSGRQDGFVRLVQDWEPKDMASASSGQLGACPLFSFCLNFPMEIRVIIRQNISVTYVHRKPTYKVAKTCSSRP